MNIDATKKFAEVIRFIHESEDVKIRAERREQRLKIVLIGLTIVSLIATIAAGWLTYSARDRELLATATVFWHPLDVQGELTDNARNSLLKLAKSRADIKKRFIEEAPSMLS